MDNVEFEAMDVTQWAETDAYDVVYARFLLQHLRDPVDMLRRMWAAVRPGGRLIIEDAEFDGCFSEPRNEGFELFLRVYPQLLGRYGGDASIGRKLHKYFRLAAVPPPHLSVVDSVHASGDAKTLRLSTLEATADAMLAAGLASDDELAAAVASLAEFTADPDTVIGGPRVFQAWSAKPGPAARSEPRT
jgi:SAM-dependent methyltransferase